MRAWLSLLLVVGMGCEDPIQVPAPAQETPRPAVERLEPPPAPPCDHVVDVDWRSRTYRFEDQGEITLVDGTVERPSTSGTGEATVFSLARTEVGDLTSDSQPEAVLQLGYTDGRNDPPVWLEVFTERDCRIESLGVIPGKHDSDFFDIAEWTIDRGTVLVPRHEWAPDDPHCCPSMLRTETWRLTDGRMAEDLTARVSAPLPQ